MRRSAGFSLLEILMAILVAGIVAAIAIPVFNGQRTKAKNQGAMQAVRTAMDAATTHFAQDETYTGLTSAKLNQLESTLSSAAATGSTTPGVGADPQQIYVTGPGGSPTADEVTLCSASKGDAVYCARSERGRWVIAKAESMNVATAADASGFREGTWGTATTELDLPYFDGFTGALRTLYTSYGTVVTSANNLTLTCDPNYSGVDSAAVNDWDNRSVEIKMVTAPTHPDVDLFAGIWGPGTRAFYWRMDNGSMVANIWDDADNSDHPVGSWATYNAATMRYFRVRYVNGMIRWEYSADRNSWTLQATTAVPAAEINGGAATLGCGNYKTGASGTLVLDDLRIY